jgi:chemotaxis protein CheD
MGSPAPASILAQRVVVGVGDMAVSNQPAATLSTYALGSCVAVTAYDPVLRVGGILHLMLPESKISTEKAATQPAMFADTGLPFFFRHLMIFRADAGRLRIHLAGGASVIGGNDPFRIGERNVQVTLEILARMGIPVHNADLRGTVNRMVQLELATGRLTLKTPHGQSEFSLA